MPDLTFNTESGLEIQRELLIAYLNTGNATTPTWSPIGRRVTNSSEAIDWRDDTNTDILGTTRTTLRKPIITQTFDPVRLDGGDTAIVKIWNMAVKDQDYPALSAQDMLIVHLYAGTANTAAFAERYDSCAIRPSGLGGEGGSVVEMPFDVTYGGNRTVGTAAVADGTVTFTAG